MIRSDRIGIRKGWDNMEKNVTSKKVTEPKAKDRVLVLRTCDANLGSHGGFKWPKKGAVKAPDFAPTAECGQGLHGFLWGEGDGSLASFKSDAKWLVVSVDATEIIQLNGKVKFPRGIVEFCGDRKKATDYLAARVPAGMTPSIIGRFAVAGDRQTALSGDGGTSTSGTEGTSTSGTEGTSTSGNWGTSTSGARGTCQSGAKGTISIKWYDSAAGRYRTVIGYIVENGLKANVRYRLDASHQFEEVKA
jgi:hypothetical protein